MSFEYEVEVEGDIDQDWYEARIQLLGELIIGEVKKKIRQLDLIDTTDYLQGWTVELQGNTLVFDNTEEYALYLEYGTYEYADLYGESSWPVPADPKKKNISAEAAQSLPRGMQPFAPFRRVVYDQSLMERLIRKAFEA